MVDLWTTLAPLIVGSALVPIQIVITILLLRSTAGRFTAVAWVSGMTALRLLQGLVFGLLIGSVETTDSEAEPRTIVSVLLLVVAVLFFVTALKQVLRQPDEDAPPPSWMSLVEHMRPPMAFGIGLGLLAIGAKFWVFTLGAIAAIGDAQLGQAAAIVTFIVFVALAESVHLILVGAAYLLPARADAMLDRLSDALTRYNRPLVIALGVVFGTWFLVKALDGLGIQVI